MAESQPKRGVAYTVIFSHAYEIIVTTPFEQIDVRFGHYHLLVYYVCYYTNELSPDLVLQRP